METTYPIPTTRLRAHRRVAGLTMAELGEKAGIPEATVWRIETGQTKRPRPGTVKKLAEALGITVAELYWNPAQ